MSIVARALSDESGSIEFVGAVQDVTAAKQAEETLRESEAYLAEAQRLTHTRSWAWNVRAERTSTGRRIVSVVWLRSREGCPPSK